MRSCHLRVCRGHSRRHDTSAGSDARRAAAGHTGRCRTTLQPRTCAGPSPCRSSTRLSPAAPPLSGFHGRTSPGRKRNGGEPAALCRMHRNLISNSMHSYRFIMLAMGTCRWKVPPPPSPLRQGSNGLRKHLAWAGRAGPGVAQKDAVVATGRLKLPVTRGPACVREQPGVKAWICHLAAHAPILSGRAQTWVVCPALWAAPCARRCPAALVGWSLRPAGHQRQWHSHSVSYIGSCPQMRPERLTKMLIELGRAVHTTEIRHVGVCLGKAYKSGLAAWLAAFAAAAFSCWTAHPWAHTRCSTQKQDSRHVHTAALGAICSRQIRQTLLLLSFEEMNSWRRAIPSLNCSSTSRPSRSACHAHCQQLQSTSPERAA